MKRTLRTAFALSLALSACTRQKPMSTPTGGDAAHLDAMSREHAHETPTANASAAEPRVPVTASEVVYATVDGQQVHGYLARPASAAPGAALPGLVVIHEWWGLNDNVRMMARRLAGEGYQALAVDMYGRSASTPQEARQLMQGVMSNTAAGMSNLEQAAGYLRQHGSRKLGTIGWCFGGGWSLQAALALGDRADAAVMYYGRPVTDREQLSRLHAPLLGLFGGADQGIPADTVHAMEATLKELGKPVEIVVYPGAGHAFANPSGQSYQAAAAEDSWRRTVAFFAQHLK
jgi:carboxymethylenebutenolidase